jgi:hypothetical protein
MKKSFLLALSAVIALSAWFVSVDPARAIAPFKKEWDKRYVKKDSAVPAEKALAEAAATAKCTVCHMGEERKNHNPYGKELKKLLNKKTDKDNTEKMNQAFDTVEKIHSNPNDPTSPTFGDLIKQGKLPGGDSK